MKTGVAVGALRRSRRRKRQARRKFAKPVVDGPCEAETGGERRSRIMGDERNGGRAMEGAAQVRMTRAGTGLVMSGAVGHGLFSSHRMGLPGGRAHRGRERQNGQKQKQGA